MTAEDIVLVDLEGNILEGELRPSSDVDTHLEFYRNWPGIGGVVHTHSTWATGFCTGRKRYYCVRDDAGRTILMEQFHVPDS